MIPHGFICLGFETVATFGPTQASSSSSDISKTSLERDDVDSDLDLWALAADQRSKGWILEAFVLWQKRSQKHLH